MIRHPWRILGASAAVGASAYIYHTASSRPRLPPNETFEFAVRSELAGPDGKRGFTTQTLPVITMTDADARIKEHATLRATPRPDGLVWKHATAQLASNSPIEDAHAEAIVERDQQDGDYLFFAVMDGHSGFQTSRLLSKTLIPAVALQLRELAESPTAYETKAGRANYLESIRSLISSTPKATTPFDADSKYVALAIQTAFAMVDSEIVNAPLRLIAEHLKQTGGKPDDPSLDLSKHPMVLATMLPALSGSCALLALLDTAHRDLYVACTGDCRAVAGVWEEGPEGSGSGTWRVDVLSDDQTGRNPNELKRLQSEHPKDEAASVVQRGRILGGLEPSRAFGDSRYKWPLETQKLLSRVFLEGNDKPIRRPPPDFKTPPYVTAQPVITHRKLDFLPLSSHAPSSFPVPSPSSAPSSPSSTLLANLPKSANALVPSGEPAKDTRPAPALRFLILATDGLWDQISSRDAVALVGAHLSGLRAPAVSRSALHARAPTRLGASSGVEGKDKNNGKEEDGTTWAFVDAHPGAHLLRNAFGGADQGRLRRLLTIPAPHSRRYRDDVTVTVVWWEDGRAMEARTESVQIASENGGVSSKL